MHLPRLLLGLALLAAGCASDRTVVERGPVRVLILDGQNNHDWARTTRATRATLEATGRFAVDVETSPADRDDRAAWEAWLPDFDAYDVVLSNFNDGGTTLWSPAFQQALVTYVDSGGGFVVVHAANNSSGDWDDYNRMIGVGGWGGRTPEHGCHLRLMDHAWVKDAAPDGLSGSHGPQHAFLVEHWQPEHPVLAGVPTKWMHAKDELYDSLRGPAEEVEVLASAWSAKTERHEPMILTIRYGLGRVFHTPMGHVGDTTPVHCVGFQTILARGTEWAATGAVTLPVPAGFPSEDAVSVVAPADVDWGG
jgi:type 1 glutamine amidotransferase